MSCCGAGTGVPEKRGDMSYRALKLGFIVLVLSVVLWRVSENTVDPDLWGHVLYGQRMAVLGEVERVDPFSWTASGQPWINHEVGAEWIMGQVHRMWGGHGLFLMMVTLGLLVFVVAVRSAGAGMGAVGMWAWALGLLASRDIAYGFAMRPQVFSAAFLVILLLLLRALQTGWRWSLILIPVLMAVWINVHGGVLAGVGILIIALSATLVQAIARRVGVGSASSLSPVAWGQVFGLMVVLVAGVAALGLNPFGLRLPLWLLESAGYMRPEIVEWQPIAITAERLPFAALIGLVVAGWWLSRREKQLWEPAVCLSLAVMAGVHQRHLPLFALSVCVLMPRHVADAATRLKGHYANLAERFESGSVRTAGVVVVLGGALMALWGAGTQGKERILTLEVPRNLYPVAAMTFMREAGLQGRLLNYFDWGQQAMWELPQTRVSFDGRLDTCYSRAMIAAHWAFYRGASGWEGVLPVEQAEVALLPTGAGGMEILLKKFGWKLVYQDPLASVAVSGTAKFPGLTGTGPVVREEEVLAGRDPFPDVVPPPRLLPAAAQ